MDFKFLEYSYSEIRNVAEEILKTFPTHRIFLLKGDLGAGKTSLVKEFLYFLGDPNFVLEVSSPTYSIVQEYVGKEGSVYHVDLYRLKNNTELLDLGILEYIESNSYIFIEWPEKIESYLQDPYLNIQFTVLDSSLRRLEIQPF